ncbi:MAG TPA: hypothetical protein VMZ00_06495 [Sporichthya sp.]|nr:hypothetical protein [Sporichthya sp.]
MADAGYSGKPVLTKLGLKPGMRVLLVAAPAGFAIASDEVSRLSPAMSGRTRCGPSDSRPGWSTSR